VIVGNANYLDPVPGLSKVALAIADGFVRVVGRAETGVVLRGGRQFVAFVTTSTGVTPLELPGSQVQSEANDVTLAGWIVGTVYDGSGRSRATRWKLPEAP
jgi:hypothetical protein